MGITVGGNYMKVCISCKKELDETKFEKYRKECKKCRYKRRTQKHSLVCLRCGNEFKTSQSKQKFCSAKCQGQARRMDKSKVYSEIENRNFILKNTFETNRDVLKLECKICGYESQTSVNNFLDKKTGCKNCAGLKRKSNEEFLSEVYGLTKDEYSFIESYKNKNIKILVRHNECGNIYPVSPDKFLRGRRCPYCKQSHGELKIRDYLISHGLEFETQWTHDECKHVGLLRFDFAVFENKELTTLIEFDGEQHFKYKKFFHDEKGFEESLLRDSIKDNFCEDMKINLIRIPYYKIDEVEKILDNFFKPMKIPSQA